MDLSVIIPFVGEYPQVLFTIQSVAQNLINTNIDFEIIAVNNYCDYVKAQAENIINIQQSKLIKKLNSENIKKAYKAIMPTFEDRSGEAIKASAKINPWLKYFEYKDRLSHWQAKRHGVNNSSGDYILFVDAHTIPSHNAIPSMYEEFISGYDKSGTMHLPLTYKILESHRLIYKLKIENKYFYSYSFTPFRQANDPYEVPCMSTCGMIISRKLYDSIGGWPTGLGIYGGGENFLNYVLAVTGYNKFIYPFGTLFHHGEKRDYHYIGDDFIRNRMIAHYLFGGIDLLRKFTSVCKGRETVLNVLRESVIKGHRKQRNLIKSQQVINIEDWASNWVEIEKA